MIAKPPNSLPAVKHCHTDGLTACCPPIICGAISLGCPVGVVRQSQKFLNHVGCPRFCPVLVSMTSPEAASMYTCPEIESVQQIFPDGLPAGHGTVRLVTCPITCPNPESACHPRPRSTSVLKPDCRCPATIIHNPNCVSVIVMLHPG